MRQHEQQNPGTGPKRGLPPLATPPRSRLITCLVLLAIAAVGFVLRTANAASVLVGGRVILPENDPDFHVHRVLEILANFPHVPLFDPRIDYPLGGIVIWPPLFDFALAAMARALGLDARGPESVVLLCALVVPVVGALTCIPIYFLARQIVSRSFALFAAGLATLVPAHVWYSRLGFVDHHVAVTLLQVTMFAVFLHASRLAAGVDSHPLPRRGGLVAWALAGGLVVATGFATWNGFAIFVVILATFLAAAIVTAESAERRRLAAVAALAHALAALALVPLCLATSRASGEPWSPLLLSLLHVAGLVGIASTAALAWARETLRAPATRSRRLLVQTVTASALLGLAGAATALWLSPLGRGFDWLLARDPFMGSVQEVVPLLPTGGGRPALVEAGTWMTWYLFAAPLILAAASLRVVRERARDRGLLLLVLWSGALLSLSLLQRRFGETFAPALGTLVAWGLERTVAALDRLDTGGRRRFADRIPASAVATILMLFALGPYYSAILATPARATSLSRTLADPLTATAEPTREQRQDDAAKRLGALVAASRTMQGSSDGGDEIIGVMNAWPIGHRLIRLAGVGATSTPFGGHARPVAFQDWSNFFLATDEHEAVAILERRRLRYVVVEDDLAPLGSAIVGRGGNPREYYGKDLGPDGTVIYPPLPPLMRSLYFRLTKLLGSEATLSGAETAPERIPALEQLRLVLDSASDSGGVLVFERVAGARLRVQGRPGEPGTLELRFRSDQGRERSYSRTFTIDASGHADVRVPYGSPDVPHGPAYRLCIGATCQNVVVPDVAVRAGETIQLPLS